MQTVYDASRPSREPLELPERESELLPGVAWGSVGAVFTPAYWAAQLWYRSGPPAEASFRLGQTLAEESAACLLGGHGISGELGAAAFRNLRNSGLLSPSMLPSA